MERYRLDRVLLEGTVDSITPVMMEEQEGEKDQDDHAASEKEEEEEAEEKEVEEEDVEEKEEEEEKKEEIGAGGVSDSERGGEGLRKRRVKYFRVLLQGGVTLEARQVVLATGPTRSQMANVPGWVEGISEDYPEERLQHTVSLMHHLASARHAGEGENQHLPHTTCRLVCIRRLPLAVKGRSILKFWGVLLSFTCCTTL